MINKQLLAALDAMEAAVGGFVPGADEPTPHPMSVMFAIRALALLIEAGFTQPSFGIEPDGDVWMDWNPSQGRLFSMTVASNGDLIYGWILNGNHGNGVSAFDRVTLPIDLTSNLSAVTCETTK